MRTVRFWLSWWVALLAMWGLLVATTTPLVWAVGAAVAAVAATAAESVRRQGLVRFRPSPRWLRGAWRLPWQNLRDSGRLGRVLWRRLTRRQPAGGRFVEVPWPTGEEDRLAAARHTLAVATLSLTPNTYVVDVDTDRGTLLLHQLVPDEDPPLPPSLLGPP